MIRSLVVFYQRYRKNKAGVIGSLITVFFICVALLAPYISTRNPLTMEDDPLRAPSSENYMGTDDLGRDIYSGFLYGARVSLFIGFLAAMTATALGVLVGAVAGYYGGWLDDLLMRTTELTMIIPRFFLALLLVAVFGANLWNIIFTIGVLSWTITARLVRVEIASLKEQQFVEAARALGASRRYVIFFEILPNVMPSIIVAASLQVSRAILLEASLSYFGLGDPSVVSWGWMLKNAQQFLEHAWWMALFPGLGILLATLGLNLTGDALNDVLNPRLRSR